MIIIKQRSTDSAFEEDYDHAYYGENAQVKVKIHNNNCHCICIEQQSRLHHHQNPPDNSVGEYTMEKLCSMTCMICTRNYNSESYDQSNDSLMFSRARAQSTGKFYDVYLCDGHAHVHTFICPLQRKWDLLQVLKWLLPAQKNE